MTNPVLEVRDPAVHRLVRPEATLERLAAGLAFTEGPVWRGNHLLFSDLPNNRICRWQMTLAGAELTTWRHPSGGDLDDPRRLPQPGSNGLTLDRQGRLIACEHGRRRVSRTEANGTIVTLASHYAGRRLNSPNDVIVRSDGLVFFTHPPYGLPNQSDGMEQDANAVYRIEPDGRVVRLVADFERPNGLAFAPDERTLYVADTRRLHLRAFTVTDDGDLTDSRIFADMSHSEPGGPDGLKVDREGNVYSAGATGIWVFAPTGRLLGIVRTPERPANCGFGDHDWCSLFIAVRECVYRIRVEVLGVRVGPA